MEKIPTAKKVYHTVTGCVLESHHNPDIEKAMIEFAKLHVTAALTKANQKSRIKIGPDNYIREEILVRDAEKPDLSMWISVDENSILNSYPLDKIK